MTIMNIRRFKMTASEIAMGRYMRAPDHSGGEGGAPSGGESSSGDNSGSDDSSSSEAALEREFQDPNDAGASDDDDGADGEDRGSSASDGEDDGASEDDDGDDADEDGEGDEEEGEEEPKSKNRNQKRIDTLTTAARESERKAAEATRQAEYWRNKAEGLPAEPAPGEDGKDPNAAPDPADFEFGEADSKFIAALAKHEAKMEMRQEGERARVTAELNTLEAKYQSGVTKALEKYPDYDEVVTKGAEANAWKCPPVIALGIRASDVGHDIAYHLATNTGEADRIAGLSNIEQAREFGRLEGRFEYKAERAKKAAETPNVKKPSSAPKPPKAQRAKGGRFAVKPDTDDFAQFDKNYGN